MHCIALHYNTCSVGPGGTRSNHMYVFAPNKLMAEVVQAKEYMQSDLNDLKPHLR
jgi:hypothetical protein